MGVTRTINYYEDFDIGDIIQHQRGRTVTEMDNVMFTQLALNTAEGHFNEDLMNKLRIGTWGGKRVMVGSFTIGLVIGLAAEDISENALAEIALDKIRLQTPVYHGDTIYAESEVLNKEDTDILKGAGIIHFKVTGKNQDGKIVFQGEKKTAIKKRAYYLKDDEAFWPRH